jgi:hypothetical protein
LKQRRTNLPPVRPGRLSSLRGIDPADLFPVYFFTLITRSS